MSPKLDEKAVIAEFRKRFRRQMLMIIPALLAVGLLPLAAATERADGTYGLPVEFAGAIATIVVLAILVFSLFNWRCPACNRYLGKSGIPSFCIKCGARLR